MSDQGTPPPPYDPPPPYGGQPPAGPPPPGYGYGGPAQQPGGQQPESYLVWSILTTVFCCLPLGIVSIVFAAQVSSKWQMGDVAGAQESSRRARLWAIWSAVAGVALYVLIAVFVVISVVAAVNSGTSSDFDSTY